MYHKQAYPTIKSTFMEEARTRIISIKNAQKIAAGARRKKKIVVTTNGCFDILHVGHIRNLQKAHSLGDMLIVAINSDSSVRINKGPGRPIVPAKERAEVVSALRAVDYVFIFNDKNPIGWLKKIKPHIHVKGGDRKLSQIIERDTLKKMGTKLVLLPHIKGKSTTNILKRAAETG